MNNRHLYNQYTREWTVPASILSFITEHADAYGQARHWLNHFKANGKLPGAARDLFYEVQFQNARKRVLGVEVFNPATNEKEK